MAQIHCIYQHDSNDCGPACISTICSYYGKKIPIAIIKQYAKTNLEGTSGKGMKIALAKLGLASRGKLLTTIVSARIRQRPRRCRRSGIGKRRYPTDVTQCRPRHHRCVTAYAQCLPRHVLGRNGIAPDLRNRKLSERPRSHFRNTHI